ncbi:hypothetical protein HDU97_001092 [Phlyctochytrium planicorne]|nr:hypothetical protein HDU97_001092 [Phlyctochytrium planicorne]
MPSLLVSLTLDPPSSATPSILTGTVLIEKSSYNQRITDHALPASVTNVDISSDTATNSISFKLSIKMRGEVEAICPPMHVPTASAPIEKDEIRASGGWKMGWPLGAAKTLPETKETEERTIYVNKTFYSKSWNVDVPVGTVLKSQGITRVPITLAIPADLPPSLNTSLHGTGGSSCSISYTMEAAIKLSDQDLFISSCPVPYTHIGQPVVDHRADSMPSANSVKDIPRINRGGSFGRRGDSLAVEIQTPRSVYGSGDDAIFVQIGVKNVCKDQTEPISVDLIQVLSVGVIPSANTSTMASHPIERTRTVSSANIPGFGPDVEGKRAVRLDLPGGCGPSMDLVLFGLPVSLSYQIRVHCGIRRADEVEDLTAELPVRLLPANVGMKVSSESESFEDALEDRWKKLEFYNLEVIDWQKEVARAPEPEISPAPPSLPPRPPLDPRNFTRLFERRWQDGSAGFQSPALFYFDVDSHDPSGAPDILEKVPSELSSSWSILPFLRSSSSARTEDSHSLIPSPSFTVVIHTFRSDLNVKISKDSIPSWWSTTATASILTPSRTADIVSIENRVILPDKSHEITCRLVGTGSGGVSGRYFVSVACPSLIPLAGNATFRIGVVTPPELMRAEEMVACDGCWVTGHDGKVPSDAWAIGSDFDGMPIYAARMKLAGGLHMGMVSGPDHSVVIPYGGKGVDPLSEPFDVLTPIINSTWVTHVSGDAIHPKAIVSGYEADGRPLYIGRTTIQRGLLDSRRALYPGKVGLHNSGCNIVLNGKESSMTPFEVLIFGQPLSAVLDETTLNNNQSVASLTRSVSSSIISSPSVTSLNANPSSSKDDNWVVVSFTSPLPPNAWHVGADLNGDPLYVARGYISGILHIGKVGPNLPTALFPIGGKEVPASPEFGFQVLTKPRGATWVECESGGPFPEDALGVGFDEEGRVLYVGRGRMQKSVLDRRTTLAPGKTAPHLNGCVIPFDGREVLLTKFEVLVIPKDVAIERAGRIGSGDLDYASRDTLNRGTFGSATPLVWEDDDI